jgi:hypothetical protein
MLNDLVSKIRQTQLPEKDEEAEQFLKQSLATAPDAQYILAQTVLVQNIALEQAKSQIQQLQDHLQEARTQLQQPPAPAQHTSFLGSLLGRHDSPPPPQDFSPQGFPPRPAAAPQYYHRRHLPDPASCAPPQLPPPASPPAPWPLRESNQFSMASATAEAVLVEVGSVVEASEAIAQSKRRSSTITTTIQTRTAGAKSEAGAKLRSMVMTASATTIAAHSSTTPATTPEIL